jgi:hypothetical protein
MAKGQVSEEELARGLKGIGNFGGLTSARVQRDNPFRDSRLAPAAEPGKTIEVMPLVVEQRVTKESAPAPKIEPKVAVRALHKTPKAPGKERGEEKKAEAGGTRKADVFTERVTLQISPEMRDDVERLARELQRAKFSKKERITGNTVPRRTPENRPSADTSKPANGAKSEQDYLYLATGRLGKHFCETLVRRVYTDLTWAEDTGAPG